MSWCEYTLVLLAKESPMENSLRVLLVEDNRLDVRLLMAMLANANVKQFQFTVASQLWEALDYLESVHFDAILLDLNLPDSNDLETVAAIHTAKPDLPIVVLTGLNDESVAIKTMQMGAQDYLIKGRINSELLRRSIQYAVERQRLQTDMRELALRDPLTGLYNRRGFFALAEQQLLAAQRAGFGLWLCFADLDGLKRINDEFGHIVADQALMDAANILREVFRASDIVARFGGDEFIVLGLFNSAHTGDPITDRLTRRLGAFNAQATRPYPVSLSVGLVRFEAGNESTLDDLIRLADQAMYANKASKKIKSAHGN